MDGLWEMIEPVSALASMLGGFGLILLLTRVKVPIMVSILAGAAAVSLLFGRGIGETGSMMVAGLLRIDMLALSAIIISVIVLTQVMRKTGRLEEIVLSLRLLLRRPAVSMAAVPAMIGLLPMPGGALFSAPLVAAAAGETNVSGVRLSAINFWFRHVWEYWWPLYPGVILAMQLVWDKTGTSEGRFLLFNMPLSIPMILGGLVLFVGSHPDLHISGPPPPRGTKRRLLRATSPIWIIILIYAAGKVALVLIGRWTGQQLDSGALGKTPILVGLATGLIWTIATSGLSRREIAVTFAAKTIYKMLLIVLMTMIYKHVIETVQAGRLMGEELADLHVPTAVVVAVLPLIAGLVLGVAVGFVGTAFPIILPLVADKPEVSAYIALAYAFGHMGQMLSPIHICHIVTIEYFKTNYRAMYPRILPPAILTAAGAVAYFLLLRWLLG